MSNNWRNIWNFLLILWHCENGMIQRILWSKNFMNFIVCSTTGVSLYLHIYTVLYGKKQLLGGSIKKLFLKISQNSQENNCIGVFFNKLAGLRSATLLKKEIPTKYFSCKFVKFLRTAFFTDYLRATASIYGQCILSFSPLHVLKARRFSF